MREDNASELKAGEVEKEKTRRVRLKPINREQMVLRWMLRMCPLLSQRWKRMRRKRFTDKEAR